MGVDKLERVGVLAVKEDNCHSKTGMTKFCELQQYVVGLASGSTTAVGPGACVHGPI